MAFPLPWYGAHANCKIGDSVNVVATTTTWSQVSGTDYTGEIREIRITGGEGDITPLNFVGTAQAFDESRPSEISIEFTKAHQDRSWAVMAYGTANEDSVGTTGFTRVSYKDMTGDRVKKAVAIKYASGTAEVHWLLNNAVMTKPPEQTISNEGFVEDSVTFKCLVSDVEYEDNSS